MFCCLLTKCPQSPLISSINRQIIVLMEYSLSLAVTDKKKEIKNEIIGILRKIANADEINNTQSTVFEDDQKDEKRQKKKIICFHRNIVDFT